MKFNVIGAGALGLQLAYSLHYEKQGELQSIYNRQFKSAEKAIQQLGVGSAAQNFSDLKPADITFITTPDDAISSAALNLVKAQKISSGHIVAHCSGALTSEILASLKSHGALIVSAHPLKAFAKHRLKPQVFVGCDCIIEGDEPAKKRLSEIFLGLGAHTVCISKDKKPQYHAAAVMASNYIVTLAEQARLLLVDAGFNPLHAKKMAERLMQGSLDNICQKEVLFDALTGPIRRGDEHTIEKHLHALKTSDALGTYSQLGLATLPLTDLKDDKKQKIRTLFNAYLNDKTKK